MPQVMQGWGPNRSKVVVSLCDFSGNWPRPWNESGGYTVLHYDLKHGDDVTKLTGRRVRADADAAIGGVSAIVGVMAAPPCTDFTISGAQYWPAKDADGRTEASLRVLEACVVLAELLGRDWWVLENPVGRIPKLCPGLGKPQMYFHPCDYAVYARDTERERYTKKTGLWGRFVRPVPAPLSPIRVCAQGSWLQKLGGKSERTKELRSMTPEGFARAFYLANATQA